MDDQAIDTLLSSGTQTLSEAGEDEQSNEQRLIASLDDAAIGFSKLLLDDSRDDENRFVVSLDQRMELFKMVREWIAVRRRTKIDDESGGQAGVADMQARIKGPAPAPTTARRGPGRPSKAELQRRAEEDERARQEAAKEGQNDDSGWRAKLAQTNPNGGA